MALSKITNGGITGMSVSSTDVTVSSGDLLFGTANKGVCLGVTSNTDSNTVDDYEEGLHSPTITPDSGSVSLNASHTKVSYVKIGDYVTVNGHLVIASSSSATGRLLVSLPFTPADLDLTAGRGALPIVVTGTGSNVNNFCAFYGEGVAAIDIRKANANGVLSESANELNGNDDIYFQVSFRTS